jgi:Cu(I)/Ag(I) efflux system membrane protein CusA/SilA
MTVTAIIAGLLPIMWSQGTGADVMKRIAAPMVGGMFSTTILGLVVLPMIFLIWKGWALRKDFANADVNSAPDSKGLADDRE